MMRHPWCRTSERRPNVCVVSAPWAWLPFEFYIRGALCLVAHIGVFFIQVLLALESPYFVVLVCILVILDVRLSAQNDLSSSAVTFQVSQWRANHPGSIWPPCQLAPSTRGWFGLQAWVTGFFLLELIARAYYHSELHDIKVFMLNPLTIVDCFALLMDLIVFAANADSGESLSAARAALSSSLSSPFVPACLTSCVVLNTVPLDVCRRPRHSGASNQCHSARPLRESSRLVGALPHRSHLEVLLDPLRLNAGHN